jgi:hypothetical protein
MPTRAVIVEALLVNGVTLIACDMLEGDLASGMLLSGEGTNEVWQVAGLTLPTPDLHRKGRRGATLVPQHEGQKLGAGDVLVG